MKCHIKMTLAFLKCKYLGNEETSLNNNNNNNNNNIIIIIIIIIIMSLFKGDEIFSTLTYLTYSLFKSKTYINIFIYICTK